MAPVEIYTSPTCGYCFAAKRLLAAKGVAFTEIDVVADPARRPEMERRSGRRTAPPAAGRARGGRGGGPALHA